jgi:hypothetical protein
VIFLHPSIHPFIFSRAALHITLSSLFLLFSPRNVLTLTLISIQRDAEKYKDTPLKDLITIDGLTGLPVLPWWMSQPYFRTAKKSNKDGEKGKIGNANESGYLCSLRCVSVHEC